MIPEDELQRFKAELKARMLTLIDVYWQWMTVRWLEMLDAEQARKKEAEDE